MGYIEGHSRDQMLLLPASVDDYVAADDPVRFVAACEDIGAVPYVARPQRLGRCKRLFQQGRVSLRTGGRLLRLSRR